MFLTKDLQNLEFNIRDMTDVVNNVTSVVSYYHQTPTNHLDINDNICLPILHRHQMSMIVVELLQSIFVNLGQLYKN